jgi:hypothetical protein
MGAQDLTQPEADDALTMDGLPVIRHRFGGGAALVVGIVFLVLAGGGVWLHDAWYDIRFRMLHPEPNVPAYLIDPATSPESRLERLRGDIASDASRFEQWAHPVWMRDGVLGVASVVLERVGSLPKIRESEAGRGAQWLGRGLRQAIMATRISRDHARLVAGQSKDFHGFLMQYRDDPIARDAGYVSSVLAMLQASDAGRPVLAASMNSVDDAFAQIKPDDPKTVQAFLAGFRTNPYARERGYVASALALQGTQEDEAEARELVRQKNADWVWD